MNKNFKNKIVIVTGAGSGIGKEAAIQFARHGANVVLTSRSTEKLNQLESEITSAGGSCISIPADLTSSKETDHLVEETIKQFGRIDILLSNAGVHVKGRIADTDLSVFRESLEINFLSHVYLIQKVLPYMKQQKSGSIAIVNTLDSKKGIVGDGPYSSAKGALDLFGDILRQELNGTGIYLTMIYPGRVDTPMIENLDVPLISKKLSADLVAKRIISGIIKKKTYVVVPLAFLPIGALNQITPRTFDWLYRVFKIEGKVKK
jgi:short-subunit dehydrogenase